MKSMTATITMQGDGILIRLINFSQLTTKFYAATMQRKDRPVQIGEKYGGQKKRLRGHSLYSCQIHILAFF